MGNSAESRSCLQIRMFVGAQFSALRDTAALQLKKLRPQLGNFCVLCNLCAFDEKVLLPGVGFGQVLKVTGRRRLGPLRQEAHAQKQDIW